MIMFEKYFLFNERARWVNISCIDILSVFSLQAFFLDVQQKLAKASQIVVLYLRFRKAQESLNDIKI